MPDSHTRLAVLLFTDIVGSTDLKSRLGAVAYARVLARHNALFEQVGASIPGMQILKHTGDGYFAAFEKVAEAVRFALLFQRAMRDEAWAPVPLATRVGINVGEVTVMQTLGKDDIIGLGADLAARIMSLAVGGQILLTRFAFDEARQFVREHPPVLGAAPTLRWMAHGPYVFKGAEEPLEVFEVGAEDSASLIAPPDSEKVKRQVHASEEATLGWRPAIGLVVPERSGWRLEKPLGTGGFGEVWLAANPRLPEKRVFKFCFDEQRLRSFKRELTLVRLLRDALGERDDIVRIDDIKVDAPPFFLESKYSEEGDLHQWAERQGGIGAVPLSTRLDLVARTAVAIGAAHSVGVLHKDIKPPNVLIETDKDGKPTPRLVDFGIGTLADKTVLMQRQITAAGFTGFTQTGSEDSRGTPLYMPPEVLAGGPFTVQGDVYALGVLLYQMIVADLARPLAPGWERHVADPLLRDDVAACVDGDPAHRLNSALELADRLQSLESRRAEAKRAAEAEAAAARETQTRARLRRTKRLAGAFAAIGLLAVAAAFFAFAARRDAEGRRQDAEQAGALAERLRGVAMQTATRSDFDLARLYLDQGEAGMPRVLAHLARAVRSDPGHSLAVPLLVSVLRDLPWMLPTIRPLRHEGPIRAVSFSADGHRLVTASDDRTARLWNADTGEPSGPPFQHALKVNAVCFSPDGRRVLTASDDRTAQLWDAATGQKIDPPLRHEDVVLSASFSQDGKLIVTTSDDHTARLWDASTGQLVGAPLRHRGEVLSANFDRDARRVVTASWDGTARIWDTATGRALGAPLEHLGHVASAVFSADGRRVVTASWDGTARVWDAATGRPATEPLEHAKRVVGAVFSPDGSLVLTASDDHTARLWDAVTGKPVGTRMEHGDQVTSANFSPDGEWIVTSSNDKSARVWNGQTGADAGTPLRHEGKVVVAAFSPEGQRVVTASQDGTARVWEASSGAARVITLRHSAEVRTASFSADGRQVATASSDGTARLWDATNGEPVGAPMKHHGGVYAAAFSTDGKWIVTGAEDRGGGALMSRGMARVWDAATGAPLSPPLKHPGPVGFAAFLPLGRKLLTTGGDRAARVWDLATGQLAFAPLQHDGTVQSAAFSSDGGRIVTASADHTARVWSATTGEPIGEPLSHARAVTRANFSPDGRFVVTAADDRTARVWDAATGQPVTPPLKHDANVTNAVFSADGGRVATASSDPTGSSMAAARVWDARTGEPLTDPLDPGKAARAVTDVTFSPDGRWLLTTADNDRAQLWDAATGQPIAISMKHRSGGVFDHQVIVSAGGKEIDARPAVNSGAFSRDGRRVLTASADGTAQIRDVAVPPGPAPAWLPELAEALGGRWFEAGRLYAPAPIDFVALREKVRALKSDDPWTRFGRWFLERSPSRASSPDAKQ